GITFRQTANRHARDAPNNELAEVTEDERNSARSNLRHVLVDGVFVSVDCARFTNGDARNPQGATELVEHALQDAQRVVMQHVLRGTAVGRVHTVFQVDEVRVADGVRAVVPDDAGVCRRASGGYSSDSRTRDCGQDAGGLSGASAVREVGL